MEFAVLALIVAAVLAAGIGLGRLVAPRIGRWADTDEEPRDDRPG
ncbi:MAG TPA: hypothetical protein VFO05_10335 [Candidatus Limnocylindrales bacterium]|nr:hypothetical protein [Candidatus Limnocylindrales bacterium]